MKSPLNSDAGLNSIPLNTPGSRGKKLSKCNFLQRVKKPLKTEFFRGSLLLFHFIAPTFFAVADDSIIPFSELWTINISGKYIVTSFSQEQSAQYITRKPWALGLGVRYKDISVTLFLPSFQTFNEHPFKSFDIQIFSFYDSIYYDGFCKLYRGFLDEESGNKDVDLQVFSSGISAGWLRNSKRHSLSAAYNLDCRQTSSSESAVLGFGIFYTSLFSNDKNIRPYNETQRFVYFGPNLGYSYTFIFPQNIFLNMNLVIGLDAGLNVTTSKWLFIPLIMPKISLGHHNKTWSINFAASCNYTAISWDINTIDKLLSATIKATFSKRF